MQQLFQSRKFEEQNRNGCNFKVEEANSPSKIASNQSILGGIAKIISDSSTNALLKVIQDSGGIDSTSTSSVNALSNQNTTNVKHPKKSIFERSMGVAASGLAQNEMLAGNQILRTQLRKELGGAPTTVLSSSNETVGHHLIKNGRDNSSSRSYRNNLKDDVNFKCAVNDNNSDKMSNDRKRVSKRLLQSFRNCNDNLKKSKIKFCLKKLKVMNNTNDDSMVNTVFELNTADEQSYSSADVAEELINFVDNSDLM